MEEIIMEEDAVPLDPMARIEPTPENPRGYPAYNVNHVHSYTNGQIDWYRKHVAFTPAEAKKLAEGIKTRNDILSMLGGSGESDKESDAEAGDRGGPTPSSLGLAGGQQRNNRRDRQSDLLDGRQRRTPLEQRRSPNGADRPNLPRQNLPLIHDYDDTETDSDCPEPAPGRKGQKFSVGDMTQLKYDSDMNTIQTWLNDLRNVFESNPAMFPDGRQKIIRATASMEPKLKTMHTNIIQTHPKLRLHWRKFLRWVSATILRGDAKKDQAARQFTQISQGWSEDPHVFYQKLFALANQTGRPVTIDDFVTRLIGPLQTELKTIRMLKKHTTVDDLVDDAAQIWATRKSEEWKALALSSSRRETSKPGDKHTSRSDKAKSGGVHAKKTATPSNTSKLSKSEREHRQRNNLCFNCGFPGHSAAECKHKFNDKRVLLKNLPKSDDVSEKTDTRKTVTTKKRARTQAVEVTDTDHTLEPDDDDQSLLSAPFGITPGSAPMNSSRFSGSSATAASLIASTRIESLQKNQKHNENPMIPKTKYAFQSLPVNLQPSSESQTDDFSIALPFDTWGTVMHKNQKRTIPIGLDTYSQVDLVSYSFVKSLGIAACQKTKHQHDIPTLVGVGELQPRTYGIYHLRIQIADKHQNSLTFTRPFLAVDRSLKDSQVLLGRPALKAFKMTLINKDDEWEFERSQAPMIERTSVKRFIKDLTPSAQVMQVQMMPVLSDKKKSSTASAADHIPAALRNHKLFNQGLATALPRHRNTDHEIKLTPGGEPPYLRTYNLSPGELKVLEEYIDEALKKGWIRPSSSPAGAPILFTLKKNGKLRLCVDYRGLNAITVKNRYPLPLIGEMLDRLNGATVFSKLDLTNAYYRIRIKEGDEWKTAFRTKYGHFEYMVMPFGLTNAPATFQSYINHALKGLIDECCVVYLDDILIFSKNAEDHQRHIEAVMNKLCDHELYAQPDKCTFYQSEVEFLGFIVNARGIQMDQDRVKAIRDWPRPKTYRDIQVFLGFCNFYRRFIFGFSRIARPLHLLLKGMKKGRKPGPIHSSEWTTEQDQAFRQLIDAFTSQPVLRHYDPSKLCRLETDASDFALAGILSQKFEDGCWHPIAYYSRKFNGAEMNYPVYDKEMMAIVCSFRHWRHYLQGAEPIEVWSDHENLTRFMKQVNLNGRQSRWLTYLMPYDFTIHYRKGSLNPADGPSRRPDYSDDRVSDNETEARSVGSDEAAVALLKVLTQQVVTRRQARDSFTADNVDALESEDSDENHAVRLASPDEDHQIRSESPYGGAPVTGMSSQSNPESGYDGQQNEGRSDGVEEVVPASESIISDDLVKLLAQGQELDPICQQAHKIMNETQGSKDWSLGRNGLVHFKTLIYVPQQETLRCHIMELFHDCPSAGHWGRDKTTDLIQRHFTWKGLRDEVAQYVASCPQCQFKAIHRHKPYGELQPLPVPTAPFQDISLDWITGLPASRVLSGQEYNSILTIVDRFTKYALFIPVRDTQNAAQFAQVFFEKVECAFGTPRSIVTDRDSRITSMFWKEVCEHKMIKRRLSTAYHPQTDGQSEVLNRIVEDYLRAFTAEDQTTWAQLLPLAQFAYNNSRSHATQISPNRALYGIDCAIRIKISEERIHQDSSNMAVPAAKDRITKLEELRSQLIVKLTAAQERMSHYYNKRHTMIDIKAGALVKLSTRNLRLQAKKLAPRWIGPFRVQKKIGSQAYELILPPQYQRLHPVFSVSMIEPWNPRQDQDKLPLPELEDEPDQWEVEDIRDESKMNGITHFLVKWVGWPSEYNTWEPEEHLEDAPLVLRAWRKEQQKRAAKAAKQGRTAAVLAANIRDDTASDSSSDDSGDSSEDSLDSVELL
ncbi:hypothetical protein B7494_g8581 [Chlorociboria aeruginascens]|nr:hypothetical protein B7494_g8581 [Chlorociboria aeruginascens]